MERKKQLYSRVFLGVKLVPLTSRVRKASAVCQVEGYCVAMVKPGVVAISSDDAFRAAFDRSNFLQERIAHALGHIGAVQKGISNKFVADLRQNKRLENDREAAADLQHALGKLGLTLTKAQQRSVNRLTVTHD